MLRQSVENRRAALRIQVARENQRDIPGFRVPSNDSAFAIYQGQAWMDNRGGLTRRLGNATDQQTSQRQQGDDPKIQCGTHLLFHRHQVSTMSSDELPSPIHGR